MREFRIVWSVAKGMASGAGPWEPWDAEQCRFQPGQSDADIVDAMRTTDCAPMVTPDGLDIALKEACFAWHVEVRWNDG